MTFIVYLTVCTTNNKIYVGVHQTEDPNVFDGYLGNGVRVSAPASYKSSKTPFQYAVNKYGPNKFKRITLKTFDTKEEAYAFEASIVDDAFLQRPDTYNIKLGGEGGCPEVLKKKVYMYDLDGNFVKEFDTVYDCNKYLHPTAVNGGHIPRAIKLGHVVDNYQFSYEKLPYMKKYERKPGCHIPKKVGRFNEDAELLETYESYAACFKAGYKNLSRALKQGIKCKGFYFKYINE